MKKKKPTPKKMSPITTKLISNWKVAKKESDKFERQIINRINYVLDFLFKAFGNKVLHWYFEEIQGNGLSSLSDFINKTTVHSLKVDADWNTDEQMNIILKDGREWCWNGELPLRWLYEPFEKEIINGKKLMEDKEL